VFSPTEAAGVACFYAIVVTLLIYRELTLAGLWRVTTQSVYLTAQVLIIVGAATILARLLTIAGVPQEIVAWMQALQLSPWMVMLAINLLLLVVGCFLDPASAILVLAPLLKPVVLVAGIDPIHFGVVLTVNQVATRGPTTKDTREPTIKYMRGPNFSDATRRPTDIRADRHQARHTDRALPRAGSRLRTRQ
jgi:TRAP-type C4-dicarboxylate transport system permease large subunit